ncbi:hypothetical protein SAMN05444344_1934 [Tenacibaculum mesophilum]|uniref:Suppressor of fused protein (SUFU) n=1 Tax=Tenacibaculum mesophilum TaxID=104268 RepID=A0ABN5T7Y0_9FLAO|nr:hypothetical protein [Tenacibaculum mesophilum]AZJ32081.1 hypothetical protein D6200_05640 [Tenacibaculum mesophilum]QFS27340.1 hypothetical protein F9Y86_02510 [Tenacibaculum mesophilum]SHF89519.1 hypothetical protein SAMN05444344_1934 [Tenacibaculum mesophilum]
MNYEQHFQRSSEIRNEYWQQTGTPFSDVIGSMINPTFLGGPKWPSLRQAHIGINTDNETIIATDGLSDPYDDYDTNSENQTYNGIGLELYAISGNKYEDIQQVIDSWEFKVIRRASNIAAANPNISYTINDYTYISTTIDSSELPEYFVNEDEEVGILLGLKNNSISDSLKLSIEEIALVNITHLTPKELAYILENGAEGRNKVAELLTNKNFHKLTSQRESVI